MTETTLLIDSHILIWLLYEPEKISGHAVDFIKAAKTVYVSTVSLWELALKHSYGKLAYSPEELAEGAEALGLKSLTLQPAHVLRLRQVELPYKDPFDRMLLAQARAENCSFVTADRTVLDSGIKQPLYGA